MCTNTKPLSRQIRVSYNGVITQHFTPTHCANNSKAIIPTDNIHAEQQSLGSGRDNNRRDNNRRDNNHWVQDVTISVTTTLENMM